MAEESEETLAGDTGSSSRDKRQEKMCERSRSEVMSLENRGSFGKQAEGSATYERSKSDGRMERSRPASLFQRSNSSIMVKWEGRIKYSEQQQQQQQGDGETRLQDQQDDGVTRYERQSSKGLEGEVCMAPPDPSPPPEVVLGFKELPLLDVKPDDPLNPVPWGCAYGELDNGLHYYVRKNAKPKERAALCLGVNVGSILEEEGERGLAHIVEHMAFSGTKKYAHNSIIKFLESIGSPLGPCSNAFTSCDQTTYEFLIPIDKPDILPEALDILSEFATEVLVCPEDLEKERGAVLEEWRQGRDCSGRISEAYWKLLMKGSKYADRDPIGLERVIKTVTAKRVQEFYHRWYAPQNMAVVAVGDFPSTEDVVELIKQKFEGKKAHSEYTCLPKIPIFSVPDPHEEPRFSCFSDPEVTQSSVSICWKVPYQRTATIKDYRFLIAETMYRNILNTRLYKVSKQKNPPFFSCRVGSGEMARPMSYYEVVATCPERGTVQALEQMLIEVARVRQHGFSEREIKVAGADLMATTESTYLMRDQLQSETLRAMALEHFMTQEPLLGIEYKTQLEKTLLPEISAADVSRLAECYHIKKSCTIKVVEPHTTASKNDLMAVVAKVDALEKQGDVAAWDEENLPRGLVAEIPIPGSVVDSKEYPCIGATEINLSNGMRVAYKCTKFLENEILFSAYAVGGITEIEESHIRSCIYSTSVVNEVGPFGHKPAILREMLAGKIAEINSMSLGMYKRTLSGNSSTFDLESALEMIYQLFVTTVEPTDEAVELVMQRSRDGIKAAERDPYTAFNRKVREIRYGNSVFYEAWTEEALDKVDPKLGCLYFTDCFKDPSTFNFVFVGNIDTEKAIPLIVKYLGGIPKPEKPVMNYKFENLNGLTFNPPDRTLREEICVNMVEAQCSVFMNFPVELKGPQLMEEMHFIWYMCSILESRLQQVLRYDQGKVYDVVAIYWLGNNRHPWDLERMRGDVAIYFNCDPGMGWNLVEMTLDEVKRLQSEGPSPKDVKAALECELRSFENNQQENEYWLERISGAYQSPLYTGDLQAHLQWQDMLRESVREKATDATMREAFRRIIPFPCKEKYTAVVLMPKVSRLPKLLNTLVGPEGKLKTRDSKIALIAGGLLLVGGILWRSFLSRRR